MGAVRRLHHRIRHPDSFEPRRGHPATIDRPLAPQLEPEFDEELSRGREVVDHDADVFDSEDLEAYPGGPA